MSLIEPDADVELDAFKLACFNVSFTSRRKSDKFWLNLKLQYASVKFMKEWKFCFSWLTYRDFSSTNFAQHFPSNYRTSGLSSVVYRVAETELCFPSSI